MLDELIKINKGNENKMVTTETIFNYFCVTQQNNIMFIQNWIPSMDQTNNESTVMND